MPEPGKEMRPLGRSFSSWSFLRNGAARPWVFQSGLQTTWWMPLDSAHLAAIFSAPGPPAMHEHHVRILAVDVVERCADRLGVLDGLGAGDGNEGAFGQVHLCLAALSCAQEVAGIDRGGSQLGGAAEVRAVARSPGVAGVFAVALGGGIAELLEGVAAIAEVAGALDDSLQLPGVDLGPVLGVLQVFQFGREPVHGAVQAHGLHVQGVDEAPEEAFSLVGELGAVGCDLFDELSRIVSRPARASS